MTSGYAFNDTAVDKNIKSGVQQVALRWYTLPYLCSNQTPHARRQWNQLLTTREGHMTREVLALRVKVMYKCPL